jgi:hypothetical protein
MKNLKTMIRDDIVNNCFDISSNNIQIYDSNICSQLLSYIRTNVDKLKILKQNGEYIRNIFINNNNWKFVKTQVVS